MKIKFLISISQAILAIRTLALIAQLSSRLLVLAVGCQDTYSCLDRRQSLQDLVEYKHEGQIVCIQKAYSFRGCRSYVQLHAIR